jgi:ribosomal protein S18 acetylase RimI-like enzyme
MTLSEIKFLSEDDDPSCFSCGKKSLDDWIKKHAYKSQKSGSARVYVICDDDRVVAYYAVCASSVVRDSATSKVARNSPDPIPVFLLGRLAVDSGYERKGLGKKLLKHALRGMAGAAEVIGAKAILVHALDDEAAGFYRKYDFEPSAIDELILFISMNDLRQALGLPPL